MYVYKNIDNTANLYWFVSLISQKSSASKYSAVFGAMQWERSFPPGHGVLSTGENPNLDIETNFRQTFVEKIITALDDLFVSYG